FDKLQQANRINDNGSWPYLRSHPLTTQRIADMQSRLPSGGLTASSPSVLQAEHAMVTARARVLSRPGVDVLRQWVAEPQGTGFAALPPARQAGVLYAAALGSSQLRDAAGARRWAGQLQQLVKNDAAATRLAKLLRAELELAADDAPAALAAMPPRDSRRPEMLLRTQILLRTGQSKEVTGPLQTWLATHPRDASAWQAMAAVWNAQGQPLRAVRAEAEVHAARYDYAAAVDRFKAGQDLARRSTSADDHFEASIIDTRLRAVQSLLREQAAER
ncbi:MAG TPA: peptidase M48, partial [Acidovorax temperans]|nr:peptidase M48 [Acidovorax temperans]